MGGYSCHSDDTPPEAIGNPSEIGGREGLRVVGVLHKPHDVTRENDEAQQHSELCAIVASPEASAEVSESREQWGQ